LPETAYTADTAVEQQLAKYAAFLCCMTVVELWARHQWRFDDIWPDPAVLLAVADTFFVPQVKQTHTATATYASH